MRLLLSGPYLPFTASLAIMVVIGVLQAFGFAHGDVDAHVELNPELDADGGPSAALDWLNLGRLPLLMLLVVALFAFGASGFALQGAWRAATGAPLPVWIAASLALIVAAPLTRSLGRLASRLLPGDETTAVPRDSLVGRVAVIVTGAAVAGSPAQARVRDAYGQRHYLMLEPDAADERLVEGERVIITRRAGATFYGIRNDEPALDNVSV